MPEPYVPQLGRISGKMLEENLRRNGIDLAFDTTLLYLKVDPQIQGNPSTWDPGNTNPFDEFDDGDPNWGFGTSGRGIGVNTNSPNFYLDVSGTSNLPNLISTDYLKAADIYINTDATITTDSGAINIRPNPAANPTAIFDRIEVDALSFDGNLLSNVRTSGTPLEQSIIINSTTALPAYGIRLETDSLLGFVNVTGNLRVQGAGRGNITLAGDLSTTSNIIIGDGVSGDVVVVQTDFSQDINPGLDLQYNLGAPDKRWRAAYIEDWQNITTVRPQDVNINNSIKIDGTLRKIHTYAANTELTIDASGGYNYLNNVGFQEDNIINTLEPPTLNPTLVSAGISLAAAGDPSAAVWNTVVTGNELFLGGGQTIETTRTAKLGDIRNDLDNPDIINLDDATKALEVGNQINGTTNEQLWYHTVIKPYILSNPSLYSQYSNGVPTTNKPLTITPTGAIAYVTFSGTNGLVIPAGTSAQRQYNEVGDTRWNTELSYMEVFDGERYIVATGPGAVVTRDLMVDLAITRALFLG